MWDFQVPYNIKTVWLQTMEALESERLPYQGNLLKTNLNVSGTIFMGVRNHLVSKDLFVDKQFGFV